VASNRTLLILGGTGIIGKDLCRAAVDAGHRVTVVSRGRNSSEGGVRGHPQYEELVGDVNDPDGLREALGPRQFDAVVDLLSFTPTQVERGLALFGGRCSQYVLISSATVYAAGGPESPIVESTAKTTTPWDYPAMKIASEAAFRAACARIDQSFTIVRPYITYSDQRVAFGAWETRAILDRLAAERPIVIGQEVGQTLTSLTHSRDLARGIVALLGNPRAINEDFHIASEEQVTWASVHEVAAEIMGKRLSLIEVPDSRIVEAFPELAGKISDRRLPRVFDNGKLRAACPSFRFEYSVRDGYSAVIPAALAIMRQDHRYATTQGRMDRLLSESVPGRTTQMDLRQFARSLRRESVGDYLKYSLERHTLLASAKRVARSARRGFDELRPPKG
jgi:nucleoside-diphosphate-sugar epimerase